jgi:hypothetical protein
MKSLYVVKLFFAVALGVLAGQAIDRQEAKAHDLGRQAFLANQSARFDRDMAHHTHSGLNVLGGAILVVGFLAAYEIASFWGAKCITLIAETIRER